MTEEQAAAFIISQVCCATAEIEAMKAANLQASQGPGARRIPFGYNDFMSVPDKYCIGHNSVLGTFAGVNRG